MGTTSMRYAVGSMPTALIIRHHEAHLDRRLCTSRSRCAHASAGGGAGATKHVRTYHHRRPGEDRGRRSGRRSEKEPVDHGRRHRRYRRRSRVLREDGQHAGRERRRRDCEGAIVGPVQAADQGVSGRAGWLAAKAGAFSRSTARSRSKAGSRWSLAARSSARSARQVEPRSRMAVTAAAGAGTLK